MVRAWIVIVSVLLGILSGFVGYFAWLYRGFHWWPWVSAGRLIGVAVGIAVYDRPFR
jgi:hypothetical protein